MGPVTLPNVIWTKHDGIANGTYYELMFTGFGYEGPILFASLSSYNPAANSGGSN